MESNGFFSYDPEKKQWSNNEKSRLLLGDFAKTSWLWFLNPYNIGNWMESEQVLESDLDSHQIRGIKPFFEYAAERPELLSLFQKTMTVFSAAASEPIIAAIDLSESTKVVDVGGGEGLLVLSLAKAYPNILTASVYDRPEISALSSKFIEENNAADKVSFISGDFFESIPEGFDAITLKYIIHDWPDDKALIILSNARKVLAPGNKIFIIDQVVERGSPGFKVQTLIDIMMVLVNNGKERSKEQFEELFNKTGFRLESITPAGLISVIKGIAI